MRLAYSAYCSLSFKPHISSSCSLKNEKRSDKWALSPSKKCQDCVVHPAATYRALKAQSRSSIFTSEVSKPFKSWINATVDKCVISFLQSIAAMIRQGSALFFSCIYCAAWYLKTQWNGMCSFCNFLIWQISGTENVNSISGGIWSNCSEIWFGSSFLGVIARMESHDNDNFTHTWLTDMG